MIWSAEEFIRLRASEDKAEYDRAANDQAPIEIWEELVSYYPDMRVWVVHNKTVPISVLEALSTDADASVRSAVARKRKAPPEVLRRLASDSDSSVRYAVACNPKAPEDVLRLLLNDQWETVSLKAKERLQSES
jgi:hypothetical protein